MSKYVVFDLEMCMVPYGKNRKAFGHPQEMIQIGAVMLNEAFDIVDTFMTFVHPEYGYIDTFIEKLTGIKRRYVANAPRAAEAIRSFCEWIPENAVLVSWSENDKIQLRAEINGKGIKIESFDGLVDTCVDCQQAFGEKLNSRRRYKLSEALNMATIDYADGEHDALVDAHNTALLFKKIQTEDVLQLCPYLIVFQDANQSEYYRTNSLLPGLVRA